MIKAIIFDMGGTVFEDVTKFIEREVSEKFGIDSRVLKEKLKPINGMWHKNKISTEEFFKRLSSELKISDSDSLKDIWNKTFAKHAKPKLKMIEMIKKIKSVGYKVAVLSNTNDLHETLHNQRKDYEIFPYKFLSNELGMKKPEKEIYEHVVKSMGVKFEECIFIDDHESNLEPARKLGMKTILFRSPEQVEKELIESGVNGI